MKLIAYYRVSTHKQKDSGLGLDAQQRAVAAYAVSVGGVIVASYEETESGADDNRPELDKAIAHAEYVHGKLIVAKLDRISRHTQFLCKLMDDKVPFAVCDMPLLNEVTVPMFAAISQHERTLISERTKRAMAEFRATNAVSKRLREKYAGNVPEEVVQKYGGRLGSRYPGRWDGTQPEIDAACRNGLKKAQKASVESKKNAAMRYYRHVAPKICRMREMGLSFGQIAKTLNLDGCQTRSGKSWTAMQVFRVIQREAECQA